MEESKIEESIKQPKREIRVGRLFLFFFLAELIIYVVISSLNFSNPSELSAFNHKRNTIDSESYFLMVFSIFKNNFTIASMEVIPILGVILYSLVTFDTAYVLAIEGTGHGISGLVYFLSLGLLPDTWLEIPTYAIACSIGTYIIYYLIKDRRMLRMKWKKILSLYGFVALELLIAAMFESYEIVIERSYSAPYDIIYTLMMWIPAIPVLVLLVVLFRKINLMGEKNMEENKESEIQN